MRDHARQRRVTHRMHGHVAHPDVGAVQRPFEDLGDRRVGLFYARIGEDPRLSMGQHVVQRHELGFDPERGTITTMTIVGFAKERVERLGAQVIDVRTTEDYVTGHVLTMDKLLNQIGGRTAARLSGSMVESDRALNNEI